LKPEPSSSDSPDVADTQAAAPENPSEVTFDAPVAALWRGSLVESVHRGRYAVRDAQGEVLDSLGDPGGYVHLRSSAKPFQALPLVFSGAADAFGITREEISVACGSHSAEPRHLAAVRSILRKAGLSEDDLQSGAHPPMHAPTAARLVKGGEEPRPIHGNCSGKHAGMLAVCAYAGWDPAGYRDPHGPLQKLVQRTVAKLCGLEQAEVWFAGDGCGVPALAIPLGNLALGFARLGAGGEAGADDFPEDLLEAVRRVREAMCAYPYMVAGTGRFDTKLMQTTDLVAKSGAEAVFAAASLESGTQPAWGLAFKVSDGAGRAVAPAVGAVLTNRGVRVLAEMRDQKITDLHGEEVGKVAPLSR
jgi:L-asparaginase II